MKARTTCVFSEHLGTYAPFFHRQMLGKLASELAREYGYFAHSTEQRSADITRTLDAEISENPPVLEKLVARTLDAEISENPPVLEKLVTLPLEPEVAAFAMDLAASMAFANAFLTLPNPAVGAVVISRTGRLLAASAHRIKGGFHAERRAILLARRLWGEQALRGCVVVCTLEPCSRTGATPPCCDIIAECGASAVIFGALDGSQQGVKTLANANVRAFFMPHFGAMALARQFFARDFAVFKQAVRATGDTSGQISGAPLVRYTHEMRSKMPTLSVFGDTLRKDLPTLDARYSLSKKAPNLLIFSRQSEAALRAQTAAAACWTVQERSVSVRQFAAAQGADCAAAQGASPFTGCGSVLVEGGPNSAKFAAPFCDWLLLHFAKDFLEGDEGGGAGGEGGICEAKMRQAAAKALGEIEHFKPLAQRAKPLVLGRSSEGQFYAFYELASEFYAQNASACVNQNI